MSNYFSLKSESVSSSGGYFATGTIIPWPKATVLNGFLRCDGTAVSRTTYADLFAVIGTSYGAGDGASTFNVPDLQGKIPLGDDGSNFNIGSSGGNNSSTPNIVFGSSTVNISVTDPVYGTNSVTDSQNVSIPAHTHNWTHNATNGAITAFGQRDSESGNASGFIDETDFATVHRGGNNTSNTTNQLNFTKNAPAQTSGTNNTAGFVGISGSVVSAGSGNGSHAHALNKTTAGSASFNQSNLSANSNAVDVLQPYVVCRFLIRT